jgi:hypothetical protein
MFVSKQDLCAEVEMTVKPQSEAADQIELRITDERPLV